MKITMGSHLTNAAKLSNDWGPPLSSAKWLSLMIGAIRRKVVLKYPIRSFVVLSSLVLSALLATISWDRRKISMDSSTSRC